MLRPALLSHSKASSFLDVLLSSDKDNKRSDWGQHFGCQQLLKSLLLLLLFLRALFASLVTPFLIFSLFTLSCMVNLQGSIAYNMVTGLQMLLVLLLELHSQLVSCLLSFYACDPYSWKVEILLDIVIGLLLRL